MAAPFELNKFFNNMPVRILGTQTQPVFYAFEIADIFNFDHHYLDRVIRTHFDPSCYVSNETLKRMNIVPRMRNGTPRKNLVMITEYGVYRMIEVAPKNSRHVEQFRKFFYETFHVIRMQSDEQLRAEIKHKDEELKKITELKDAYKKILDKIYVFRLPHCKYEIQQTRHCHSDDELDSDDSDYDFIDDGCNMIDEYEQMATQLPHLLADRHTYKIIQSPSEKDFLKYTYIFHVYCNRAEDVIKKVNDAIGTYKTNKTLYTCSIDTIEKAFGDMIIEKMPTYDTVVELPAPEPRKRLRDGLIEAMSNSMYTSLD